jgi:hypothetical protein
MGATVAAMAADVNAARRPPGNTAQNPECGICNPPKPDVFNPKTEVQLRVRALKTTEALRTTEGTEFLKKMTEALFLLHQYRQ